MRGYRISGNNGKHLRQHETHEGVLRLSDTEEPRPFVLSPWPVDRPRRWVETVNEGLSEEALTRLRVSVQKGRPFGAEAWVARTAKRLGLESTLRGPGRPREETKNQ